MSYWLPLTQDVPKSQSSKNISQSCCRQESSWTTVVVNIWYSMCRICYFVVHDGINKNSHAVLGQDLKFILMKSWTKEAISLLPEVVSQMFGSSYQSSRKCQQKDLWKIHPGPAHHQWEVYQVEILQPVHIPKWDICFHNVVNRISSIPAQLSPQRTKTKEGRQRSKKGIQLL